MFGKASEMLHLNLGDVVKGLLVAILSSLFVALTAAFGAVIQQPSFDVFSIVSIDWVTLGKSLVNMSIVVSYGAFTGYLTKNLFSTSRDSFLNVTPELS